MSILRQIFETLREYYAAKPDYTWWPENPIEVIFGAILVTGSTWPNVAKILTELRSRNLLDFEKIVQIPDDELLSIIRPAGFQSQKKERIKAVSHLILKQSGGNLDRYFARDFDEVRNELLAVPGIGPGTADNILLYAGQMPVYMVDMFTIRMLVRHGIVGAHTNNRQIQELVHRELTPDEEPYGAKLFQKMQEYLVRLGRDFCDKSRPNCLMCPLQKYLPEGGAVGVTPVVPERVLLERALNTTPRAGMTPRVDMTPRAGMTNIVKPGENQTVNMVAAVNTVAAVSLDHLNETERKMIEAMKAEPVSIDDIAEEVQLPIHIVRATIAVLQMKKLAVQVEGNKVKRLC